MKNRGFTLIELIVVIAIIAVLAAIIAPNAFKAVDKAKVSATLGNVQGIKTGAMSCYSDTGIWIASCATVAACQASLFTTNTNPVTAGWDGPYIDKWPAVSGWANGIYIYTSSANTNIFNATTAADERYTSITLVPLAMDQKIDSQLDGAVGNATGAVRYPAAGGTTTVLISRNGPID